MSVNKVDKTTGDLIQIAGKGRAEYGASTVRTGQSAAFGAVASDTNVSISITFDTPMPDANYIVALEVRNNEFNCSVINKTASGFDLIARNLTANTVTDTVGAKYIAFKLYTDTEYNAVLTSGSCAHGNSAPFLNNQPILTYLRSLDGNTKFATFSVGPSYTAVTDKINASIWYAYNCYRLGANEWRITAISLNGDQQYIASVQSSTTQIAWTQIATGRIGSDASSILSQNIREAFQASINAASVYSLFNGATQYDRECGWYGYKHGDNAHASATMWTRDAVIAACNDGSGWRFSYMNNY